MTPEELAKNLGTLEQRAVACPRWRWMSGMRWFVERAPPLEPIAARVTDFEHGFYRYAGGHPYPGALPDFDDPATLGCLRALVREAWAPALIVVYPQRTQPRWQVETDAPAPQQCHAFYGATEAEALVAALEGAP